MAAHGGCLCGGVRYEVNGALRDVIACHCSQCRRTSGNYVAATSARNADLVLTSDATLAWYRSSDEAERGFCARCGGNLFWRQVGGRNTSIMAGTLDPPTRLKLAVHIFVEAKSDYYEIADGVPQHAAWPDE
jgi:hypothetical protein